jgi:hypothetical protein
MTLIEKPLDDLYNQLAEIEGFIKIAGVFGSIQLGGEVFTLAELKDYRQIVKSEIDVRITNSSKLKLI